MSHAPVATRLRPIIRVFVSSTFSDLKLERDALQQRVFPKLEQLCLQEGFQFQAIDLRWGVSSEAGLDHRTMRICLEELRRSQEISPEPNFLILLGNRYGWRPLPEEISAQEFAELERFAADNVEREVLHDWYRQDGNAIQPLYVLRARTDSPDGQDYTKREDTNGNLLDTPAWLSVQETLWSIVNRAFPAVGLQRRFASASQTTSTLPSIVRFQASATEQEIWCGALSVPHASRHVLAFIREVDQPLAAVDWDLYRGFFDIASGQLDADAQTALRALKEQIKQRLGENAVVLKPIARLSLKLEGAGHHSVTVSTGHIDVLCHEVESRLTDIIDRQVREYWEPRTADQQSSEPSVDLRSARELEIERDEHLRFAQERGSKETFVGRNDQLDRILAYVENDSRLPLVIHGDSGCGKTALLARAFQEIPVHKRPIIRFIGVTPRSSDAGSLLRSLCQELRGQHAIADTLPSDVHELIQEFRKHLATASPEQPLVLFLDALDQLSDADHGRQLSWIPLGQLPSHAKLVVSCLSDRDDDDPAGQPYVVLRRLPAANLLNLDALSTGDAQALLYDRWLRAAGRMVNEDQRWFIDQRLELKSACRQPLYLKLLFEEVKLWRSYNQPTSLGDSVPDLLDQLCQRLARPENHGESLVRFVFGYLAAARYGLSETEILEILFADKDYKRDLDAASQRNHHSLPIDPPRVPIAVWSRLRSDLAPYLTERAAPGANVLGFYHRQLGETIRAQFAVESGQLRQFHERLANYFRHKADPQADDTWLGTSGRPFEELTHHLRSAEQGQTASNLMHHLRYLDARCARTEPSGILNEFTMLKTSGESDAGMWCEFLRPRISQLRKHPDMLPALAWHEGSSPLREAVEVYWRSGPPRRPWLRFDRLPAVPIGTQRTETVSFTVDATCRLTAAAAAIAKFPGVGFFLEKLGSLRVVDLRQGQLLDGGIEIPRRRLLAMSASDDGRWLAVVNEDGAGTLIELVWSEDRMSVVDNRRESYVCRLPQIEEPVVAFCEGSMWWQAPDGAVNSLALSSGAKCRTTSFAGASATDVRGIFPLAGRIAMWLADKNSSRLLMLTAAGDLESDRSIAGRAAGGCVLADDRLFLLRSDGPPLILNGQRPAVDVTGPALHVPMTSAVAGCGGVVFQSLEARMYFWNGEPEAAVTTANAFPIGAGEIRAIAGTDDEILVIFRGAASCVRRGSSTVAKAEIRALMPSQAGYHAVVSATDGAYLVSTHPSQAHPLSQGRLGQLEAVANTREMLWMDVGGTVSLWSPPDSKLTPLGRKPQSTRAVAAGRDHIFFLADEFGRIFALGRGYGLMPLAEVPVENPTRQRLVAARRWLFWTGIGRGSVNPLSGVDNLETLVIYRQLGDSGSYQLELAGHRIFPPSDGLWTLSIWDETRGRLACFFQTGGGSRVTVRLGTPEEFLASRERHYALSVSAGNFSRALPIGNGVAWLVHSSNGIVLALEAERFDEIAAFEGTRRCSDLAGGPGPGGSVLTIEAHCDVLQCTLEVASP